MHQLRRWASSIELVGPPVGENAFKEGMVFFGKLVQRVPVSDERIQELCQAKTRGDRYNAIEAVAKDAKRMGSHKLKTNKPRVVVRFNPKSFNVTYSENETSCVTLSFDQVVSVEPFHPTSVCRLVLKDASGFQMIIVKMETNRKLRAMIDGIRAMHLGPKENPKEAVTCENLSEVATRLLPDTNGNSASQVNEDCSDDSSEKPDQPVPTFEDLVRTTSIVCKCCDVPTTSPSVCPSRPAPEKEPIKPLRPPPNSKPPRRYQPRSARQRPIPQSTGHAGGDERSTQQRWLSRSLITLNEDILELENHNGFLCKEAARSQPWIAFQ